MVGNILDYIMLNWRLLASHWKDRHNRFFETVEFGYLNITRNILDAPFHQTVNKALTKLYILVFGIFL